MTVLPFGQYGKYSGATVTMYTSITDPEVSYLQQSWKQFEKCTGITIRTPVTRSSRPR